MKAIPIPISPQKAADLLKQVASEIESVKPFCERPFCPEARVDFLSPELTHLSDLILKTHKTPFAGTHDWPFQVDSALQLLSKAREAASRGCDHTFDIFFMAASELAIDALSCAAHDCGLDPYYYKANEQGNPKLKVIK
ncbi:hypothetical protein BDK62_1248 [Halomonas alkaliantarctica]|nr:hypothetical protein BDK62_1248 [Halomonas alkaliantarctica]